MMTRRRLQLARKPNGKNEKYKRREAERSGRVYVASKSKGDRSDALKSFVKAFSKATLEGIIKYAPSRARTVSYV